MKIFITVPALKTPHGGIRVIIEWANRLSKLGHEIGLYSLGKDTSEWCKISESVHLLKSDSMEGYDCLIITSPHSIEFEDRPDTPKKVFIFAQMAEDLFDPGNRKWVEKCKMFATSKNPMFSISLWNIDHFRSQGRTADIHYIGNGVNLEDFPISYMPKDGKTVLIEGWECYNNAKDVDYIAHYVAKELKKRGYTIIAFSQFPIRTNKHIPHEYYCKPDLKKINELYERATILIKASKYDARSCAPMEAMAKGTVTARAIHNGDDDLNDGNSIVTGYDKKQILLAAQVLLGNEEILCMKRDGCYDHIEKYSWDYWMNIINEIICR